MGKSPVNGPWPWFQYVSIVLLNCWEVTSLSKWSCGIQITDSRSLLFVVVRNQWQSILNESHVANEKSVHYDPTYGQAEAMGGRRASNGN
jgi:hypothetical protein